MKEYAGLVLIITAGLLLGCVVLLGIRRMLENMRIARAEQEERIMRDKKKIERIEKEERMMACFMAGEGAMGRDILDELLSDDEEEKERRV